MAFVGVLGAAVSAQATPLVYTFTSGSATITATFGAQTIASGTIPMNGVQVTFDSGVSVPSFQFLSTGPNAIPLSGILAGTTITLTNVNLVPSNTPNPYSSTVFGSAPTFNYSLGPVGVSGTAQLAGVINAGPSPFSFNNPILTGQISTLLSGQLTLNGITLGVVTLPPSGPFPGGNVTIKADIKFTGLVPEPGTALLLGVGLIGVALKRRYA